ncbi:MAG: Xylan 1,4-beta-xylosidase precursor [Verrucomicrobia bacterium ADurb.Bin345]|nr:MAG: Xylan 1,4-beta-xylosidase precursor [Verrucomicrobia bacterium ADurb.Bin345]
MRIMRTVLCAAALFVSGMNIDAVTTESDQSDMDINERVAHLLSKLTLEEKVGLVSGQSHGETKAVSRLGIRDLRVIDGPHGVGWGKKATSFPTGVSMGSCWNPELMEEVGRALARETRAFERDVLLGPCVNIHRTPLGGRNFESFSEDPYLTGRIGVAYVRGVQSEGIGTSLKHYACNNQEWERTTISVELDERALREIYLPHFKMIVEEAQPWTVMGAYNRVRGTYCCANDYLVNQVLKKEWGFKGVLVSDWGATHGTADFALGGLDLEMPGPGRYFSDDLLQAVRKGEVDETVIDDKVRRILRVLYLAGRLEGTGAARQGAANTPEHRALAQRLAEDAIVLLKNEGGVLPLDRKKIKSLAVIGPNADAHRAGGGSSNVNPESPVTPLQGLRRLCGDEIEVRFAMGCAMPQDLIPIPSTLLTPPDGQPGEHGLRAVYFNNMNLEGEPVLTRVDAQLDFNWGDGSPAPEVPRDQFSARWTGTFTPDKSGRYALGMTTDDGCRLFLDGRPIVDSWIDQAGITRSQVLELEAGHAYDIRAEYFENSGGASARLGWLPEGDQSIRSAAEMAAKSDAAIVFAGLSWQFEGEGADRANLALPDGQVELIREVLEANPNTIIVLINGTPLVMNEWIEKARAVVEAWYPGQEGGHAIARILFGDVNPSGKLPVSFPKRLEDNPSYANYPGRDDQVHYLESIYVGYRYYDTKQVEPLFPFGHGLSYTTFEYGALKIAPEGRGPDACVMVTAELENTGGRAGAEVVQLYVRDVESRLERPLKELKGFQKIQLEPGEKKTVSLKLKKDAFSYYDPDRKGWVAEPGDFEILLGSSSRDLRLKGKFSLGSPVAAKGN